MRRGIDMIDRRGLRARKAFASIAIAAILIIAVGIGAHGHMAQRGARRALIVSTTTSLYETGILNALEEEFERLHPSIDVAFISQGTGLALQTAMRGDADMVLVHDPARELEFMRGGYGVNRKIIAYNFFVIVGPRGDPAGIRGRRPLEALKGIWRAGEEGAALWISRGDRSGTNARELALWGRIGLGAEHLRGRRWYMEAGGGMAATLRMADEKGAYTLSDLGSYLMNRRKGMISGLEILVGGGEEMLNVYSAIAVDPRRIGGVDFGAAMEFIGFLASDAGQGIFERFGIEEFGEPLFKPYGAVEARDPEAARWIEEVALFDGSECPPEYRYMADGLYPAAHATRPGSPAAQWPRRATTGALS
jgi:tungstate transport system substrate-binding protein